MSLTLFQSVSTSKIYLVLIGYLRNAFSAADTDMGFLLIQQKADVIFKPLQPT